MDKVLAVIKWRH